MLKDIIELNKARFGSYEKLAERLDIDPTVICHWKAGRRKPNHLQIMQMADFIGYDKFHVLCLVMEEIDVHGDIRHLETRITKGVGRHLVHGDIRHLEIFKFFVLIFL